MDRVHGSRLPDAQLDTVGIAVPIDDFDELAFDVEVRRAGRPVGQEQYRWRRSLAGGGFIATGVGRSCWLEASLPKRATPDDPDNSVAVDLPAALELLDGMVREAEQFVEISPAHSFDESKLVRLDLVRDFHGVDRQNELLDGLASIDQPGRAKVRRFADPSANRAETLRVGPRAWGCTLYDKHTETGGRAPAGQLRYEARLHHDQLTSVFARHNGGHFATVADLVRAGRLDGAGDGGASLRDASWAWFRRVGFDRACTARHGLVEALRAAQLSHADAAGLWAYLTLPGWGATVSPVTRRKYRRLAIGLGYAPAFDGQVLDVGRDNGELLRLDYLTGQLAVERAA